jgi:hypothetical protein
MSATKLLLNRKAIIEEGVTYCQRSSHLVIRGVNLFDSMLVEFIRPDPVKLPAFSLVRLANMLWRELGQQVMLARFGAPLQNVDVVFFCNDITHLNQQLPVYNALTKAGAKAIFLTTKYPMIKQLSQKGRTCSLFTSPIDKFVCGLTAYRKVNDDISALHEHFLKKGFLSRDVDAIENTIKRQWLRVLSLQIQITKTLEKLRPKVVFIGNDLVYEGRLLGLCCKLKAIPTISIAHGLLAGNELYKHLIVDRFYCWGKDDYNSLLAFGLPPGRLTVSGSPAIDENFGRPREFFQDEDIAAFCRSSMKGKVVLVTLSGRGHFTSTIHHEKIINALTVLTQMNSADLFVFKLHPKDDPSYYDQLGSIGNTRIVHRSNSSLDQSIEKWLTYTDLVITGASTSAIDGMRRNKPVVTIDFMEEYSKINFVVNGVTLHCKTEKELIENFEAIKNDNRLMDDILGRQQEFMKENFDDGGFASQRIVHDTQELLRQQ